jgi:preprotein translocase subunit YajC
MDVAYTADFAFAAGQVPTGGAGSMIPQILFFAAIFAIFYFLLIRPQQKERRRREQMLGSLKKGDRVVTSGGLHGTIVGLNEQTVMLKVADQVKVEVDRGAVGRVVAAESQKDA